MITYFIGGLGCNAYYPQKFFDYFLFPIQYLDVYSANITSLTDLVTWFTEAIDAKDVTLIAHSLGGDLAVYLAHHCPAVKKLVLLDGGYVDMDSICSLDEELAGAQDYLTSYRFGSLEQAVEQEKAASAFWTENLEQAVKEGLV